VATGLTSQFDRWGRRRSKPALSNLLGINDFWVPGRLNGKSFADEIKTNMDGRVVYIPEIIAPDKTQAETWRGSWDGHLGKGTWIKPLNWRELVWAVRQANGGRFRVEIGAPDWVALEVVEKEGLIALHLVNYRQGNILENIPVEIEVDPGRSVTGVKLLSPDPPQKGELEFRIEGQRCRLVLPRLEVYGVVAVRLTE
jgi:hypothetical protein